MGPHRVAEAQKLFVESISDDCSSPREGLTANASACPVIGATRPATAAGEGGERNVPASRSACPERGGWNPRNNMEQLPNRQEEEHQQKLSTTRQMSSIPMSVEALPPEHQRDGGDNVGQRTEAWVYPSEQMFYNAMRRKGWQPREEDMESVVAIHNLVNEQAWNQVLQWERMHVSSCNCPKLKRFVGRPKDLSPKARFLNLLGYTRPFDRHDWYVDRCGREIRYVIDFYNAKPGPNAAVAMHLDVRPALDSPSACADRAWATFRTVLAGLWPTHAAAGVAPTSATGERSST